MIYTQLVLDTRRKKDSGIYTVKLRITYNRIQKYYLTGFKMTQVEFDEVIKDPPPKKYQDKRIQLDHLELKAKKIISKLEAFSFNLFEQKYFENSKAGKSIYELYHTVIKTKTEEGKISTAVNYSCSMNSLRKFAPCLSYIDVTPQFLNQYERHLLGEGKSISTVGIYLRPLRAIINEAIERKYLPINNYPFGKRKYTIPEGRNIKKALEKEDFKKIIDFIPSEHKSYEDRAKDFWLLSYLCQGMNPKDILLLGKDSIENDFIKFIRQKTKDTIRKGITEIIVPLLPETKGIIEKWKSSDEESPYLFDFITPEMTPLEIYKTVMQFVKMINKYMKQIADKVEVKKKVTCYTARFQFTKAMIEAGVSLEYIRQCLGHKSSATTQRYIGSFENSTRHSIASKYLLNFAE
jgi:integrase